MTPDVGIPEAPVVVHTPPEQSEEPTPEPCAVCRQAPRWSVWVCCRECGESTSS